jgi:hypothetical protein
VICPGTASTPELSRSSLYTGAVWIRPLHRGYPRSASTRELFKDCLYKISIYTGTVQGLPLHGSCSGTASSRKFFFLYIFFQILYIFYNTIFIPALIQGWARPRWVVTPAPGLHEGRGDWVRIGPRTGINSHRVRIEPRTGHQQSSVLTTELRCTSSQKLSWNSLYRGAIQEKPVHVSESETASTYMGAVQEQLFHGSCPWAASTRELTRNSLYTGAVQERFTQPLH